MRRLLVMSVLTLCACSTTPAPKGRAPRQPRYDVESVSGLGLFRDERERARALLKAALERQGVAVAAAELDQALALAAEGRNPLTGQACGRPLSRYAARRRWASSLGVEGSVSAYVFCEDDGGCELSVYGGPIHGEGDDFSLVAPVARDGRSLVALEGALVRLAAPPTTQGQGGLGVGGLGSRPRAIQREDRLEVRASPADHRTSSKAPEPAVAGISVEQLAACLGAADSAADLLVEVRDGVASRCEGREGEAPQIASCACSLLGQARLAPGLVAGRWDIELMLDRRDPVTLDGALVLSGYWRTHIARRQEPGAKYPSFHPQVEHPSIADWSPPPVHLTRSCFAGAFPAPGRLTTRWAVWFDSNGRPARISEQKGFPPLAPALAACVAESLKTAQAPCPARDNLWAMADFSIAAFDPLAPPKLPARALSPAADAGVTGP
jgi:hypothetical protein